MARSNEDFVVQLEAHVVKVVAHVELRDADGGVVATSEVPLTGEAFTFDGSDAAAERPTDFPAAPEVGEPRFDVASENRLSEAVDCALGSPNAR